MAKQTLREAIEELVEVYRTESSIDAYNDLKNILEFDFPKPSGPTTKVRVAISVDSDGDWGATGGSCMNDDEAEADLMINADHEPGVSRLVFVEVDVPLPEAPVVLHAEVLP